MEVPLCWRSLGRCRRRLVKDQYQDFLRLRGPGWLVVVCPPVCCPCASAVDCGGLVLSANSSVRSPCATTGAQSAVCVVPRPPVSLSPASPAVRLTYASASGWRRACGQGVRPGGFCCFQGGCRRSPALEARVSGSAVVGTFIPGCRRWWASVASGYLGLCPEGWRLCVPGSLLLCAGPVCPPCLAVRVRFCSRVVAGLWAGGMTRCQRGSGRYVGGEMCRLDGCCFRIHDGYLLCVLSARPLAFVALSLFFCPAPASSVDFPRCGPADGVGGVPLLPGVRASWWVSGSRGPGSAFARGVGRCLCPVRVWYTCPPRRGRLAVCPG